MKVQRKSLNALLMCPICLDVLRNTMTTKECLHRFCSECITTALRSGNKECPTCRKRLVSRRSLRHDPIFDALIAKLYPSREVYEKEQDELLNQVINKHQGQIKDSKRPKKLAVRRTDDDRTIENGKAAPIGAKRPYPTDSTPTGQAEELHIVLLGRTQERNKQIIIKCENDNELPKMGHIKCFLEKSDSSLRDIKLHSLEGDALSMDDEVTVARQPHHTGVLKIIYEK